MREPLKHLDRAFTDAPPELSDAVENAFRRGEQAMKQRHKLITTVVAAAGIAVAFAAIGFAGHRIARINPDRVAVTQPGPAAEYDALIRQSEPPETEAPELTITGLPEQAEDAADAAYYATLNGRYFHSDAHCSGMRGAMPIMADAALLMGKQPCPVCLPAGIEAEFCWATDEGTYYHYERECMGMMNAKYCTVSVARARGQQPCPICWK